MIAFLSKFAKRFITPADAASVVSEQAKAKLARQNLTLAERKAALARQLEEETQRFGPISISPVDRKRSAA